MRLIRFLLSLVMLGALVYFVVAVPLGTRTLWQHARAIAGSKESQELVDEVKQKAGRILHHDAGATHKIEKASAGGDELTSEERRELRKLIKKKLKPESEE